MSLARQTNHMRLQALLAAGKLGKPRHGLVSSYDPDNYLVKVRIQPEDIETGWLPITTLMSGQGWGVYFGPAIDDQAAILFQEDDSEAGFCIGFLPSDIDAPPHVESGEMHLIHKSGSFVSLTNDPLITLQMDANTFVKLAAGGAITSKGSWSHTGTLHTTSDITCDTTVTASTDVIGGGKHLKTHVHSGVTAGGGNTGQPV